MWWVLLLTASATVSSPRATVLHFLDRCRNADFEEAAEDLDVPGDAIDRGPILARHLFLVLDRHLDADLGKISRSAEGRLKDGLPAQVEEIGRVKGAAGALEPIRLFRTKVGGQRWVFSRGTVERIDAWYQQLGYSRMLDHLPASLLGVGPFNLPWWQWIALLILLLVSLLAGFLLS